MMTSFELKTAAELIAEWETQTPEPALVSVKDGWITIRWGGYDYDYELSRIQRPEDLLWLVVHLGKKDWEQTTPWRIAKLIERVARAKSWERYGLATKPNEAPRAKIDVAAERAKVTPAVRWEVLKRDGWRCRACGFSVQDGAHLHVDHIEPVSKGGISQISNLQTLCTVCNLGKSDQ